MQYIDLTYFDATGMYYDENDAEYARASFDENDASAPDCCNCGGKVADGYVNTDDKTAAICDGCAIVHDPENPYNL